MTMADDASPTLRERQAEHVAREIRLAFVRLVNERGPNGFSLRDVANEAGVSERTLYRYYPGRDELIRGVRERENATMEDQLRAVRARIANLDDPDSIAKVFAVFEANRDLVTASDALRLAGRDQGGSASRTDEVRRIVVEQLDVDPAAVTQLVGLIRTISSSTGWMRMTDPDVGLDSREAGYAAQWALEVLVDAARHEAGPLRPGGRNRGSDRRPT